MRFSASVACVVVCCWLLLFGVKAAVSSSVLTPPLLSASRALNNESI